MLTQINNATEKISPAAGKKSIVIMTNVTHIHGHRFIREFKKRGWDVSILSIQPPNAKNIQEFGDMIIRLPTHYIYNFLIRTPLFRYSEFHNIGSGVKWYEPYTISTLASYLYLIVRVKSVIRKINPGCIFSIYLTMNGFLAALTGHKRIVSSAAGLDVSVLKKNTLAYYLNHPAILRFAMKRSKKIIGFDRATFEGIFYQKGCPVDNVIWMEHWGVDIEKFCPPEKSGLTTNSCVFVCSRPYRAQFDFESILCAIRDIYKENKNIKFIIASGAQSDEHRKAIQKVIEKAGCAGLDCIEVLDHVDYERLPDLLKRCDAYIDPINTDKYPETKGWGVSGSLLETMSCGLIPVISRRASTEWILPPEAQAFIHDDFKDGLKAALKMAIKMKDNVNVRMAMREAIMKKANWNENFSIIERALLGKN